MVYIACCAASMGPIAWILVGEVFPLQLRSRGAAAATLGYGISNTLVSLSLSQRDPSHRECLDLRRLRSLLRGHIAIYAVRHSGDKGARTGEYQRVIAALITI